MEAANIFGCLQVGRKANLARGSSLFFPEFLKVKIAGPTDLKRVQVFTLNKSFSKFLYFY